MSEAASRLTVKVKLHPPALPAEADVTRPYQAPWSKTRIALAVLMLAGAAAAGFQLLYRQTAPQPVAVANTSMPAAAQPETTKAQTQAVATPVAVAAQMHEQAPVPAAGDRPAAPVTTAAATREAEPAAEKTTPQPPPTDSVKPQQAVTVIAAPVAPIQLPDGFSRIVLTDKMNNLQPGRAVGDQIPYPAIKRLYLFTELKGYAGQVLRHRWYFGDTLHTDAVLTIEDSPWRTYSENWLLDDQRGPWRVEIVDQAQKVIFQYSFNYQ